MSAGEGAGCAGLSRRLGASAYEALLLFALLLGLGFLLLPLVTPASTGAPGTLYLPSPAARAWSGALLWLACGAYCVGLWSDGRRTLPMQTWRLELQTTAGLSVPVPTALLRFLACTIGPMVALVAYAALQPAGLGRLALPLAAVNYLWALFDPARAFLQDRLAHTRLSLARPRAAPRREGS